MKLVVAALATLAFAALTPHTADACAMRKIALEPAEMVAGKHFDQGRAAEQKGELRAAIRHFERAMNANGPAAVRAESALRAARLHQTLGADGPALARLRRAVNLDATHFDARVALGRALVERAPAEALPHLQAAQDLDRLAADVYADLAIAHARLGQTEEARRNLTTARGLGADPARVVAAEQALAAGGVAVL